MTDATLWLIRARLKPERALAAIGPLLVPGDAGARSGASHKLVWSLFAEDAGAKRDFLFREEEPGRFLVLARRRAPNDHPLFDVEQKEFVPALVGGDRLSFLLRANPTIAVRPELNSGRVRARGKPQDAIWHALRRTPQTERAGARAAIVQEVGLAWLARQGEARGFQLNGEETAVRAHEVINVPRSRGVSARIAVVDYAGALTVTNPPRFLQALVAGFGRAKAFGCGLMLIRRTQSLAG